VIVKVLGSSAGGAFPQWNCACSLCSRLRRREIQAQPRTQSQLAVSSDGKAWHLLNASPDLRVQIEANPELQPDPARGSRNTPIQSAVLTNADLDHVLGLLLMRESQPLSICATESVTRILLEDNSFFGMLRQTEGQTRWSTVVPGTEFELRGPGGEPSGIHCTPVSVSDRYPRYVTPAQAASLRGADAVLGLVLSEHRGKRLGYFPGLGEVTRELEAELARCDVLFVDGTFWDDEELRRAHGADLPPAKAAAIKTARQMNHLPQSGPGGMLERLAGLQKTRKIFVHINNTNPILDEKSEEHRQVRAAGWEIAHDGMEIRL
jgi:pyrroloquinoline quinone biosynthesis protein B